ncbi:unnamed protein product [Ascophyllum nodosum]
MFVEAHVSRIRAPWTPPCFRTATFLGLKPLLTMKTTSAAAALLTLFVGASAFNVAAPPAVRVAASRQSSTSLAAYVPDGLSEQQWEEMKKKKANEKETKKKQVSSKSYESLDSFMKGMESGKRGHTFAKVDDTLTKLPPAGARGVKQN